MSFNIEIFITILFEIIVSNIMNDLYTSNYKYNTNLV